MDSGARDHPLTRLPVEDLDLILRFVLASGSIKELARQYSVSYPTMRARLDGVIDRLTAVTEDRELDPFLDELADMVESGQVSVWAAKRLRKVHADKVRRLQESE